MQQEGLYLYLMLRHLQHILVENCVRQERIIDHQKKYFKAATIKNFSIKSSESSTAICAALPMSALVLVGKA